MRKILVLGLCMAMYNAADAGVEWKLKKEKDQLKVYTASTENSKCKSVRVQCIVNGTCSQIIAVLFDIDRQKEWVFNDKYSKLLKRVQDNELIYYSEVNVPWPGTNRDFIAHLTVTQPSPDIVMIDSHAEPDYVRENKGIVRVRSSSAKWTMTSIGNNKVMIDYIVQFDPGGDVPAWLTNMFVTKGPYETFAQLQKRMDIPEYKATRFSFIKEK